ncbi:isoleucine--tRNA ligase 2 [Paenibacillus sp. J31TS4]|uniref:isoleucine--tRNA ligase n=1 Tax=Paenibacillus sp. J31TS4 TaxID=2807195 RepID=UPI001B054371|nr:isoleucine--tRNA ligase [Paenibacillus sp. J31TS4]GIP39403.1 isoleucine--tRNA ligase 2 [Paenibacillus sp. J31TS4]
MHKVDSKEKARARELRVLQTWAEEETFRESIRRRETSPSFVFYEGPPTANGAPHIGHVLGRVIKDFFGRYKTMSGYKVIRKAGWDTHGLPVELGVEKALGISGKQEIEAYGVEPFVEECKASVFRYEKQWRELTEAIGYWTDLDDPYITLTNDYIESVWHILAEVHRKGLLTRGHRVSPYCPCCQTTLSSHEVAQGYETVKDLSATVRFRLKDTGESVLAWTTTPWTLPANTALAVGPEVDYVRARQNGEVYVVAAKLAEQVLGGDYEVLSTCKGRDLVSLAYEPPFGSGDAENGYRIIAADFVSDSSGTGIVHLAPAHGEDDYRAARSSGIPMLLVVDPSGRYTEAVRDFAGRFVKDCDVEIVKQLAERGLLYHKEKFEHSYPFCWRCQSPLLYYATESWFIRTTEIQEQLIANNQSVSWYPPHLREGRFGKFLEELVDWNISRSRYWGTPLNVWLCGDCGAEAVPGSVADLRRLAAEPVPDDLELHKPYIDRVRLACPHCGGLMTRTPEVIDVWFDSGSMPFAQYHYPFENEDRFRDQFPADMIVEGIDQTRGWFYSLLAVSTLFTGQAPYKAVMATGHVLDENGQKMSKSKGNVVDPWEIIEAFGSDAFRWALLSDSAPWNSKRFSRQLVAEAKSKLVDTLQNVHAFYTLYASIDGYRPKNGELDTAGPPSPALLDRWVLSRLNSVIREVRSGLEASDLLHPAKTLEAFVEELSNWYVRRSRQRFWAGEMTADKAAAYRTLGHVLVTLSRMLAPYVPFLADDLYRNLTGGSVHLADFPSADETAILPALEQEMATVRTVVELGRTIRSETGIRTRQPLAELAVVTAAPLDLSPYGEIIRDELNVKRIRQPEDEAEFVQYALKLNLKLGGPKYGKQVGAIQQQLRQMTAAVAAEAVRQGYAELPLPDGSLRVPLDELLVEPMPREGYASAAGGGVTAAMNTELTPELKQEGLVRELIRAVQDMRKRLDLPIERRVHLILDADKEMREAVTRFKPLLEDNVLLRELAFGRADGMETVSIEGAPVRLRIEE